MELREYVRVLRRRWQLIAAVAMVAVAIAAVTTFLATPIYQSTARLFVTTAGSGESDSGSDAYQGGLFSQQRVSSYASLIRSRELASKVVKELDLDESPTDLAGRVKATALPNSVILDVTASDPDPKDAQAIAQAYADGMTDLIRELETQPGETVPPIKATVVDGANLPTSPASPQPARNLAVGLILGLIIGVCVAFLREILDTSVKSTADVDSATSAPLLGSIPFDASARLSPLVTALSSHAPRVEAFRVLRTNLQFVEVDRPDKVFVVSSAVPEEGKTTTSVNLAITMAQTGLKTLLIEGDLRRPKATHALGLDNSVGVTTVLVGKVGVDEAIQTHVESDLRVLGSGAIPPNPAELLQSNAMSEMLKHLRQEFDVVIIDAPPLLPVTDAALLAAQADGAILVVRYGKTSREQLAQAVNRLVQVDAAAVGVVMNMTPNRRGRRGSDSYGYGYGYGYAPTPE